MSPTDCPFIIGDVIDAIRNGAADLGVDEVMDGHTGWGTLKVPFAPAIGVFADELLLLRVDADHGLSVLDEERETALLR